MRIDYTTNKYVLIITSVIHLGYIQKNKLMRNMVLLLWCYYGKVRARYLNVIR